MESLCGVFMDCHIGLLMLTFRAQMREKHLAKRVESDLYKSQVDIEGNFKIFCFINYYGAGRSQFRSQRPHIVKPKD